MDPVRALINFVYTKRHLWQGIPGPESEKNQNSVGAVGSGPRTEKAKIIHKKRSCGQVPVCSLWRVVT
jgi:hypothetical protein